MERKKMHSILKPHPSYSNYIFKYFVNASQYLTYAVYCLFFFSFLFFYRSLKRSLALSLSLSFFYFCTPKKHRLIDNTVVNSRIDIINHQSSKKMPLIGYCLNHHAVNKKNTTQDLSYTKFDVRFM